MSRIKQINEQLREEIASAVEKEIDLDGALITISKVDCSPNLSSAKIFFSILPDNTIGSTLKKLKKNTPAIVNIINKKVKFRKIPKLRWTFDDTGKHVSALDEIFEKIEKGEEIEDDINYE